VADSSDTCILNNHQAIIKSNSSECNVNLIDI
jgi:hypothetical protein